MAMDFVYHFTRDNSQFKMSICDLINEFLIKQLISKGNSSRSNRNGEAKEFKKEKKDNWDWAWSTTDRAGAAWYTILVNQMSKNFQVHFH